VTATTSRVSLTADFRARQGDKGLLDDVFPSLLEGIADLEIA
jgi:hypothetical protein